MTKISNPNAKSGARVPVQQRGIETKKRLMVAGEKTFAKHGYHDVTADEIAREAGVAVGSFYAYFNNKRALFLEMIEEHTKNSLNALNESLASYSLKKTRGMEHLIRRMLTVLMNIHKESPEFLREFLRMGLYDEEIRERLERINALVLQILEEAMVNSRIKMRKRDRESLAYTLYYASEGVVHRIVLNPGEIDEKKVIRDLSKMIALYLGNRLREK